MSEEQITMNEQLILLAGYSGTGKSAALRNIRNQDKWMYLNSESGKRLPFKNSFKSFVITDPTQIIEGFDYAIANPEKFDGIVLDSLTFAMDMYESQYVINSANTMKAWSDYNQFFKEIMQVKVPQFGKPVIIIAHVRDDLDEQAMEMKTTVPIKGALKNQGVEAYFSTVVMAQKVKTKDLKDADKALCKITEEEDELGFKHVFQTRVTKQTTGTRIRSPMGMFAKNQTFMDNDVQVLLDHLQAYYG